MTDRSTPPDRTERPDSADDALLENPTVRRRSIDPAPVETPRAAPATGPNPLSVAWSRLDDTSKLVSAGSLAAILITILGIPIGAWDSGDFVLIMLVATIATAVTSGAARAWNQPMAIPLPVAELAAGAVAAVLAIWNLIDVATDPDAKSRGGIVGLLLAVALAIAAAVIVFGAIRRNGGARALFAVDDLSRRLALIGLALVLVGWALNLAVGHWSMGPATLTLAVLTLAAVIVVVSRRIGSPVPVAWLGVILGVFGAWLAVGLWSDLANLSDNRFDLSIVDILAFLVYVAGMVMIVAGGVMAALDQGASRTATADGAPPAAS